MFISGAEILVKSLIKEGVEVIFGYPGGRIVPILNYLENSAIRFVLTRHEQAAVHAADGFSRVSGKVGVCLATAGPGATNLVTGLATAYKDSVAIVAITGDLPARLSGKDLWQQIDILKITRPITKANFLIKDVEDIQSKIRKAFFLASQGRPGPILVNIPSDILFKNTDFCFLKSINERKYNYKQSFIIKKLNLYKINKLVKMLKMSKNPVICAGGGVINANASELLLDFVNKTNIPVTTTLLGLGSLPVQHPLYLGMAGVYGRPEANYALMNSDLIIVLGSRLNDRTTGNIKKFAPKARIIQVDIEHKAIRNDVRVALVIGYDIKEFLTEIIKIVEKPAIEKWIDMIKKWKLEYSIRYKDNNELKPQYIIEQISKITDGKAIICADVGQNQMWVANFYNFKEPRTFITSGGLGTAGYALPASIGVQIVKPEALVFCISGDGGIQMNIQELSTIAANKLPIKILILDNRNLGLTQQFNRFVFKKEGRFMKLENNPDFVSLSLSYGISGLRITKREEVKPVLEKALSIQGPVLIHCMVDNKENVLPQVPEGKPLNSFIWELN